MDFRNFQIPYKIDKKYQTAVAYFSMEFAIDQPLKIYSGGLGFLAGSHMRSAYSLKQNMVGIGILWKFGYYDQVRSRDQTMQATWTEKTYNFLQDTGIKFQIDINNSPVWVKARYLAPEVFETAPMFFLSTDVPENDHLAQTTCNYLYDPNQMTKVAQYVLLGKGGAKLLDELGLHRDIYHLNEAHALPAAFYLMDQYKDINKVKERLVFTTHTPEEAGNEKHDFKLCYDMSYFSGLSEKEVREITGMGSGDQQFNHSLCALRMAGLSNGVSKLHGEVSRDMWGKYEGISEIISITNAQDFKYWASPELYKYMKSKNAMAFDEAKKDLKQKGLRMVANQTGKIFDPEVLTIVWARRFAGYKRADLLLHDMERFNKLLSDTKYPVQIIWAGKPYPHDYSAIGMFNHLIDVSKRYVNVAVITGYELENSRLLKGVADVWLNTPTVSREASGTSGMTAAMNGALNFSTDDGWIPEFAKDGVNSFVIPSLDYKKTSGYDQNRHDCKSMYDILENNILPIYYEDKNSWRNLLHNSMKDVQAYFTSDRLADEYYQKLYNV